MAMATPSSIMSDTLGNAMVAHQLLKLFDHHRTTRIFVITLPPRCAARHRRAICQPVPARTQHNALMSSGAVP